MRVFSACRILEFSGVGVVTGNFFWWKAWWSKRHGGVPLHGRQQQKPGESCDPAPLSSAPYVSPSLFSSLLPLELLFRLTAGTILQHWILKWAIPRTTESQREREKKHTHKCISLVEFQLAANEFRLYFQLACCSPTLHSRSKLQVMWRLLRIAISSYYCREWEAYEAWRLFWINLLIKTLRDAAKYKHARGLRMLRVRDFPEFDRYRLVAGEWTEFLWQALYHESAFVLASLSLSIRTWMCVRVRLHKFYCYSMHISQYWKTLDFCCEYDL